MRREIAIDPAALNYRYDLQLAGAICRLDTNSQIVGEAVRRWRFSADDARGHDCFSMQVFVEAHNRQGLGPPHFRGLRHIVIACFGEQNIFTFDLKRRSITAVVTELVAGDQLFWDRVLLPIAMGVLGPALGIVPVHSACLALGGSGILIAGASGAGKSTLSVALAEQGFDFISDDWTYLNISQGRLVAHGMSVPAKLLPDAVTHFPLLDRFPLGLALNQELAYELPAQEVGARVHLSCHPRWFFFLERVPDEGCSVLPVTPDDAQIYVEGSLERLPSELELLAGIRSAIAERVAHLSCWKLSYGGPPNVAVLGLRKFLANVPQDVLA